jgi:hypothetical protein
MAMRKFLIAMLLVSAASPVLAADPNPDGEPGVRAEGSDRAEARGERHRRQEPQEMRVQRPQSRGDREQRQERQEMRADRVERNYAGGRDAVIRAESRQERQIVNQSSRGFDGERAETPGERAQRRVAGDAVREWRTRERQRPDERSKEEQRRDRTQRADRLGGGLVQPSRPLPRVFDPQQRRVSRTPVLGTEPPPPSTASILKARPERQWSTNWRHDRRYNWWDWRRRNRSLFNLGLYYDPFGWDYFRYGVGWRLWPSYYRRSFWLNDPWMYRLPPAYGPYRWVRYWDDALLVNVYTGNVVDVIHNFFW